MKFVAASLIILGSAFQAVKFSKPEHFPEPLYDFSQNPISAGKIDLGRALFYDNILQLIQLFRVHLAILFTMLLHIPTMHAVMEFKIGWVGAMLRH